MSCLRPPSFLGVFLVSLLLCNILFWLCVVYVVVNVKFKTEFPPEEGGFWMVLVGSHKTQSLRKVFGVLSLCLSFLVLVAHQMFVFYLFSLVSCQWRAHYSFCPLFVVCFMADCLDNVAGCLLPSWFDVNFFVWKQFVF